MSSGGGAWPTSAERLNGRPLRVPALVASAEAAFDSRRASASASAGSASAVGGRSSPSGESPGARQAMPPSASGGPPNPLLIALSAAVNSVGMNHTLLDCVRATSGSICRYW